MGLSSLPAPSEGVLCVLVNTALSISIFEGVLQSILHIVGICLSSLSSPSDSFETVPPEPFEFRVTPSSTFMEEFRCRVPAIRFISIFYDNCSDHECSVCLTRFETDSEINHLSCGHFFHKVCLEKWLDYWNITCPLCRTPLMQEEHGEEEASSCIW